MTNDKKLNPIGELKAQLNIPKTETRIILETEDLYPDLAVKKSKLSPAARNKVVNNGSYVSERTTDLVPVYGPCSYSGCPHSTDFRFHVDVPPINWFSGSHRFLFDGGGQMEPHFTLYNVEEARVRLREFESGAWSVRLEKGWTGRTTEGGTLTSQKNRLVREWLRNAIRDHENGYEVCIDRQFSRYSE